MLHKFIRVVCTTCGHTFDVPVYCGDRFCPICSVARRMRVRNRLNFLVSNVKYLPRYNFKHLTLTIKNQQNLSLMTASIVKSFRKLRQTPSWKRHVSGGAFVIEITGSHSDWHVHLHIIIQSKYYEWADLLKLWMSVSTGRGVFIQNIPKSQIVTYLTKYLTKNEVPEEDNYELNAALKGTRLFQPFGTWYAINKLYKPPKPVCKGCDNACFCIAFEVFENDDLFFEKECSAA